MHPPHPLTLLVLLQDVGFTGHPTTKTDNINKLAFGGKVLSTWYSGCPVCSGSRAALMTGRQFARLGVPGVFFMNEKVGLPLNETLIAGQLKKAQYATMAVGKWHLGQRPMFLPAARGFDRYLGIPYSADMGDARATPCAAGQPERTLRGTYPRAPGADPAGDFLPLVEQSLQPGMSHANTTVLEQPLDFSTLGAKYNAAILDFVTEQQHSPFFLSDPPPRFLLALPPFRSRELLRTQVRAFQPRARGTAQPAARAVRGLRVPQHIEQRSVRRRAGRGGLDGGQFSGQAGGAAADGEHGDLFRRR